MSRFIYSACLGVVACLAIAACGPTEEEKQAQHRADGLPDLKVSQTPYRCGDMNAIFKVNNIETEKGDLIVANTTYAMQRTKAASGVRYNNMGDEETLFWTMGDKALLKLQGKAYPECVEDKTGSVKIYDTPDGIRNVTWVLEDLNQRGVIDRAHITMTAGMDNNLYGNSGCNTYRGPFAMEGTSGFKITGTVMGTRMACAAPAMQKQEADYLDALQNITKAQLDAATGALILTSDDDHSLRFMPE